MRGLLSLTAIAVSLGHEVTATIPVVYRNAGPDGTCACAVASGGTSNSAGSVPVSSYSSSSSSTWSDVTAPGVGSASNFGAAFTQVYSNVQNWFGVTIYGATTESQIGAGGNGIDYTAAAAGFARGAALQPGASVSVVTVYTNSPVVHATTIIAPAAATGVSLTSQPTAQLPTTTLNGVLSGASSQASQNAPASTSSQASQNALASTQVGASSTILSGTSTTTSATSSASAPSSSGQYVILSTDGRNFACQNNSLILQPVGQAGDSVFIGSGMLMCGTEMAYVQSQSGLKRRAIAGRALSNATSYYEIDLLVNAPSSAPMADFSLGNGLLQLIVNDIQLAFALSSSVLEAYNPALGVPIGASPITVSMFTVPESSSTSSQNSMSTMTGSNPMTTSNTMTTSSTITTPTGTTPLSSVIGSSSSNAFPSSTTSSTVFSSSTSATALPMSSSSGSLSLSQTSSSSDFYPTFSQGASSSSAAWPKPTAASEAITGCTLAQNTKNVFAHMIVGNLYSYTMNDFYNDFKLAASYGIDAMALNVGTDSWELQTTALAYEAAQALFTNEAVCFKVFVSLDMSSFSSAYAPDGSYVTPYVLNFKSNPAQYYYNGKHFVSTYGGYQQFDWTSTFLEPLYEEGIDVYFVPAYSISTDAASAYDTAESDGQFLWNAWPNDPATGLPTNTSISPDLAEQYIAAKGSKTFMLNVSPWFFTHFSNDVKNFVFHSEGLWQQSWNLAVNQLREGTDFIQITSWNDFGESHYIGPIGAAEPDVTYPVDVNGVQSTEWLNFADDAPATAWIDHSAFADEAIAWIQAYKTGVFPATVPIDSSSLTGVASSDAAALAAYYAEPYSDRMYVSYRPQYHDAVTSESSSREPTGSTFAQDAITIDFYLSLGGTLNVNWPTVDPTTGATSSSVSPTTAYSIDAGISQIFIPFLDANGDRRYGTPQITLVCQNNLYELDMGTLWPVMTPAEAAASIDNFNAYTKKFAQYSSTS